MKIYKVDFDPVYPVPSGLIIVAETIEEAMEIAKETITHTDPIDIEEVESKKSGVIYYASGDY